MRINLVSLFLSGLLVFFSPGCEAILSKRPSEAEQTAASAQEILHTLDNYFAAVNARDKAYFLSFFIETEDLTVIEDKDQRLSRKAFAQFLDDFFGNVTEVKATWEKRDLSFLAPNVAVVTGTFRVDAKDVKAAPMSFRNAFTFVLVKRGERWLVKHVHESSLDL